MSTAIVVTRKNYQTKLVDIFRSNYEFAKSPL